MRIAVNDYIVIDSEICHGKPTFRGTRIMVHLVLQMLKSGATTKDILRAYPRLTVKHIKAALEYVRTRRVNGGSYQHQFPRRFHTGKIII